MKRDSIASRLVRADGKTQTVAEWVQERALTLDIVRKRLGLGWSMQQAVGPRMAQGARRPEGA